MTSIIFSSLFYNTIVYAFAMLYAFVISELYVTKRG